MTSGLLDESFRSQRPGTRLASPLTTTVLFILAILLPALAACAILYEQALPLPYQDDYPAILIFAADYNATPSPAQKLLAVASTQYFDYKLGFEHAIVAAELELTHRLNFTFLTTLGDLFLLPIAYFLWRTYQPSQNSLNRRLLHFLPISMVFFALTYWESLNWAMAALQNLTVVCFSFVAIYLITPKQAVEPTQASLAFACLMAPLAAFSSANGFLLGPLGLFVLLRRRAYVWSLTWCASFLLPLAAYLYRYTPHPHVLHPFFYLTRPLFFLAFFGSVFQSRWIAAFTGIAVLAVVFTAFRSRFDRKNPVAFYFLLWIVATAALTAWVRGAGGFVTASRYSIYSSLAVIFCYAVLADRVEARSDTVRHRFIAAAIVITAVGCIFADREAYRGLGARRNMALSGIEQYRADPEKNSPMANPEVDKLFPWEKRLEQITLTSALHSRMITLPPPPSHPETRSVTK